jgi:hypothetical protein
VTTWPGCLPEALGCPRRTVKARSSHPIATNPPYQPSAAREGEHSRQAEAGPVTRSGTRPAGMSSAEGGVNGRKAVSAERGPNGSLFSFDPQVSLCSDDAARSRTVTPSILGKRGCAPRCIPPAGVKPSLSPTLTTPARRSRARPRASVASAAQPEAEGRPIRA